MLKFVQQLVKTHWTLSECAVNQTKDLTNAMVLDKATLVRRTPQTAALMIARRPSASLTQPNVAISYLNSHTF